MSYQAQARRRIRGSQVVQQRSRIQMPARCWLSISEQSQAVDVEKAMLHVHAAQWRGGVWAVVYQVVKQGAT